ncbi:NADH dehydrogenase [ubiquinone] 1 alpha subcomplex assembly factor 2 [Galemys pyrenaicus]|uniref:NADH dehydrogenase [ubiquinone] 1 alpha subcomplex assembly factor 2 n=1 Tax=Galemys pyrenaicus TaxID=202257 RepID=A0A8J6A857_GALPY|nr:NADH dehydrogenase [ubiquinone] 1 alpha subcomplex assembly factor 2 [Galemys pyrenaicus]
MGWSQDLFRVLWRALSKEVKELVGTDQFGNKYYHIAEYKNWRVEGTTRFCSPLFPLRSGSFVSDFARPEGARCPCGRCAGMTTALSRHSPIHSRTRGPAEPFLVLVVGRCRRRKVHGGLLLRRRW